MWWTPHSRSSACPAGIGSHKHNPWELERSSTWAVSKGSGHPFALLNSKFFNRPNWEIKCFIAEDPRELQGSCLGDRTQSPILWRLLETRTAGTSEFQRRRRRGSAVWGLRGGRKRHEV